VTAEEGQPRGGRPTAPPPSPTPPASLAPRPRGWRKALRALSIISAEGSFERAAQRLGVSRSAVSHLIRDLEHQLGVRLLERGSRAVSATQDGVSTFASCWLIPRLPDLQACHSHIQLSILTTTRAVDFSSEDFDCGIRHGIGPWPDLECTLLFRETLVLVGLPALVDKLREDNLISRLGSIAIIQARTRPHDLSQWWRGIGQVGRPPRSSLTVDNRALALAAALAGVGVTLVDPQYIEGPSPMSALARAPGNAVPLPEGYFFVVPERNKGRRNINLLATWLAAEARRPPMRSDLSRRATD